MTISSPWNVGALLDSPVRLSGELIGVLCLEQQARGRAWEPDEIAFAGGLADQVGHAFANAEGARAAEDIRILAGKLMQLQDEERRRIGRELHDSTGQVLAALEVTLDRAVAAAAAGSKDPKVSQLLTECSQLARQCSQEIRTAAYLLHPPLLDELGLPTALRWLVDGFTARSSIPVQLELPATSVRLQPDQELSLFRVVQEALSNIQKHSGSKMARVRLKTEPDRVCIEVRDFGRGITVSGIPASRAGDRCRSCRNARAPAPVGRQPDHRVRLHGHFDRRFRTAHVACSRVKKASILIADDHELVRRGLSAVVTEVDGWRVVAEAGDGRAAVELALQHQPDVAVLDLAMPEQNGLEATRRIVAETGTRAY